LIENLKLTRYAELDKDVQSVDWVRGPFISAGSRGATAPPGDILAPPGRLLPSDFYPGHIWDKTRL